MKKGQVLVSIPKFNVHDTPFIFNTLFERAMTRARHIPRFFVSGKLNLKSLSHRVIQSMKVYSAVQ